MQSVFLYSQNPSYFVLGKTELENAEIYSIIQTKSQQLFVSTNEGLYEYNHGKMHTINSSPNQKGTALFDLTTNSKDEVFCVNVSGQIFRVKNNKLEVYLEIPEKYLSDRISIVFDKRDRLLVASRGAFIYDKKRIQELYYKPSNELAMFTKTINNQIILNVQNTEIDYLFEDNGLKPLNKKSEYLDGNGPVLMYKGNYKSMDALAKLLPDYRGFYIDQLYQTSSQEIWKRNNYGGIEIIDIASDSLYIKKTFFRNTYISAIRKGQNHVIFLGTNGQGVFVIPSQNTISHSLNNLGKSIRGITSDANNNIFISDRIKGIIHFKEKARIIDSQVINPNKIFNSRFQNLTVDKEYASIFYAKKKMSSGTLMDISLVDDKTMLWSTSTGLVKLGEKKIISNNSWTKNTYNTYDFNNIKERCLSVAYNESDSSIYLSTISKLVHIKDSLTIKELKYKNNPIIANKVLIYNDELWCATQNFGILVFKDNDLQNEYNTSNGLESNNIKKFIEKNNKLFVSHKKGLQILNLKSFEWKNFGIAEGITDGLINDFTVTKDKIWYVSNNELFSMPISYKPITPDFNIAIDSIIMSGENLGRSSSNTFKYNQNRLEIYFNFKGVLYEDEAIINYRLKDFDENWKTTNPSNNSIDYQYLPYGDYELEINANYRDFSCEPYFYAFKIKKAFWKTWWFKTLLLLAIISLLTFFFTTQTKRIEKSASDKIEKQQLKANLIELELKVMRSQMNPHFIFNAINSIQDLILQEDTEASYDYIVLFSDLVRNTLHFSNENFISLEKEIKFLETYLKLEALRFDESFSYKINYENLKDTSIPSLILQPFVENAIIHGLFHKEGTKELKIIFRPKGEHLECVIEDNGIGRKKAFDINTKKSPTHKSFALETIQKRLGILQSKYGTEVGYSINDLYSDHQAIGTQVRIILPFLD